MYLLAVVGILAGVTVGGCRFGFPVLPLLLLLLRLFFFLAGLGGFRPMEIDRIVTGISYSRAVAAIISFCQTIFSISLISLAVGLRLPVDKCIPRADNIKKAVVHNVYPCVKKTNAPFYRYINVNVCIDVRTIICISYLLSRK